MKRRRVSLPSTAPQHTSSAPGPYDDVEGGKHTPYEIVARLTRRCYAHLYRLHVATATGAFPSGDRHLAGWDGAAGAPAIWPDLARFCFANRLNIRRLMEGWFADWKSPDPPPPETLMTDAAVALHKAATARAVADKRRELHDNVFHVNLRRSHVQSLLGKAHDPHDIETIQQVLLEPETPHLFRYCLVKLERQPLDPTYQYWAFEVYASARFDYDAAWGPLIPPDLRRFADEVLEE